MWIHSQIHPTLSTHLRHVVPRDLPLYRRLQRQLNKEVGVLEGALEELDCGVGLEHEAAQLAAVSRGVEDEEDGRDGVFGVGKKEGLDTILVGVGGGLKWEGGDAERLMGVEGNVGEGTSGRCPGGWPALKMQAREWGRGGSESHPMPPYIYTVCCRHVAQHCKA